jgi:poly(beta-D-mannuronate) lyase
MVTLTGEIEVRILADYVHFLGFDFNGAEARTTPSDPNPYLIEVVGNHNLLQDLRFVGIDNNGHDLVPRILIRTYTESTVASKNNVVSRCWFEKDDVNQVGMSVFGPSNTVETSNTTVEECYFKAVFPFKGINGNSAVRFGGGRSDNLEPQGGNIIKNNLFDQYNGENEVISLKSNLNTIQGNTFLNCEAQVNTRSYHNNTFADNYFIGTDPNLASINPVGIWGENHIVENNYFHQVKSRKSEEGGAINLMAGTGTSKNALHEAVENVTIKNNIIYESAPMSNKKENHSIYFGNRYNPDKSRVVLPKDVTVDNNYIFNSSDIAQIKYEPTGGGTGHIFTNNKVYKIVGDPGFAAENPNLTPQAINGYTIYKAGNLGPRNNIEPLKVDDVGPLWLRGTLSTEKYDKTDTTRLFPNPFSTSLALSNLNRVFKKMQVVDVSGKILFTQSIENKEQIRLETTFLSSKGLYFIKLIGNNGVVVKKVIKQ